MYDELVCTVYESIIEIVARGAYINLKLSKLSELLGIYLVKTRAEDYALPLLDVELEVARDVEVFVAGIASFLLLGVLHALVPGRIVDKLILFVDLHEELRVSFVHASLDTTLHVGVLTRCEGVLVRVLSHTTECEERLQAQGRSTVCFYQSVADNDAVLEVLKHLLALEYHSAYTISGSRHLKRVELANVLVTTGREVIARILVKSKVKFCPVLDDRGIKA